MFNFESSSLNLRAALLYARGDFRGHLARSVAAHVCQATRLSQINAQPTKRSEHAQPADVRLGVFTVAVVRSRRRGKVPLRLVEANGGWGDAGTSGQLRDSHWRSVNLQVA